MSKDAGIFNRIKENIFSLRAQLIAIIAVICLVVLLTASFGSYRAIFEMLSGRTEQYTMQQLRQVEYNIQSVFNDVEKVANILIMDPRLQEFITKDTKDPIKSTYIDMDLTDSVTEIFNYYDFIETIDIFTDRGEIFNLSKSSCRKEYDPVKKHKFYSSALFKDSLKNSMGFYWVAGVQRSYFLSSENTGSTDKRFITAIKGVKPLSRDKSGVIAFSIDEKYLSELYNKLTDENDAHRVYVITDSESVIPGDILISGEKRKSIFDQLSKNANKTYGNLIYDDDKQPVNIVYYRIKDINWTIVREIPIIEFSKDIVSLRKIVIITYVFSFCIILILIYYWINRSVKPIFVMSKAMKDVGKGNLGLTLKHVPKNEIGLLINQFNTMSVNLLNLVDEKQKIEKEKRIHEIKALQAQINPHFLYNTLNAIKFMAIVSEAQNVAESLTVLGNIIRPVFKGKSVLYTLQEEVDYLKNYVEIFNIRYGNNISLKCNIADKYLKCRIPKFILQPLVENSILHGIHELGRTGDIEIDIQKESNDVIIIVYDTGCGMTEEKVKEINEALAESTEENSEGLERIGIDNVNRRIQLHFGRQYGIRIESKKDQGTKVFVRIPEVYEDIS